MTNLDRLSKADLIRMYEEMHQAHRDALAAYNEAIDATPPKPARVPEAEALASCVRALDLLVGTKNRSYNLYDSIGAPSSEVSRLLRSLADKYGVRLIEVRSEPCSRTHLDQLDPHQIGSAFLGAVQS